MSDFVIGWPQLWRNGGIYSSVTTSPIQDWVNTSGGGRSVFWYDGSAQTVISCGIDAGSAQKIDLVCWAGLNNCAQAYGSVRPQARGTNTPWSPVEVKTLSFFNVSDLQGLDHDIYCHDLRSSGFTTDYRYYLFYIYGGTGVHTCRIDALYPCKAFDFDRDPDTSSEFELSYSPWAYRPYLTGRLIFNGVSDQKVQDFNTNILDYKDVIPVFFYDSADIFGINKAAFVWIKDCQRQRVYRDNNRLTIIFEECL